MNLLNWPPIRRTRQHHAIEHATISILSQRYPRLHLIARSDPGGFQVYGAVRTEDLREAVEEAVRRLQSGEHDLAIHPNCGTNIVIAGVLAGLTGLVIASGQRRRWWEQLPLALLATTLALLAAQPLGHLAQMHVTTSPNVEGLSLVRIHRRTWGVTPVHRVEFTWEPAS